MPSIDHEAIAARLVNRLCEESKRIRSLGQKVDWHDDLSPVVTDFLKSAFPEPVAAPLPTAKKVTPAGFGDRKKIPPTPAQVEAYSISIGYPMDGLAWCDFYTQKGWMVGKTKMKDWQAAVRNWKTNGWKASKPMAATPSGKSYDSL